MIQRGALRRFGSGTGILGVVGLLIAVVSPPASGLVGAVAVDTEATRGHAAVYIVQLVEEPVAGYRGGRAGLAATKPARGQKLDPTSARVRRYVSHLDGREAAVMGAAGVPEAARFYRYRYSFTGSAATLTPAQVARLQRDLGVRSVAQDELRRPLTDNTPSFLGLNAPGGLWSQAGGQGQAGEDVIVGVIDTGIWPEHPSFSDQRVLADRPGDSGKGLRAYDAPPSYWRGSCQSGEQWAQDDCNSKLIGARYFLEGFGRSGIIKNDYKSARDADGHGTHTASTAAGNAGVDPKIFGAALASTPFRAWPRALGSRRTRRAGKTAAR